MPCPVCGQRFEFEASGGDIVPWPANTELTGESQFDVDHRTPSGTLEICREGPRAGEATYYVHVPG